MVANQNLLQQNSLEQNALGGNKQQVSNFMSALNQSGSSRSNNFMQSQNQNQSFNNIVQPSAANQGVVGQNIMTAGGNIAAPTQTFGNNQAGINTTGSNTVGSNIQGNTNIGTNAGQITNSFQQQPQPGNLPGSVDLSQKPTYFNQYDTYKTQEYQPPSTVDLGQKPTYYPNIYKPPSMVDLEQKPTFYPDIFKPPTTVDLGQKPTYYPDIYTPPGSVDLGQKQSYYVPPPPVPMPGPVSSVDQIVKPSYYTPPPPPPPLPPLQTGTTLNKQSYFVSDENLKTKINDGTNNINSFLNSIKAHSYEYKDKQDGEGVFHSPMAQELEATELGKQAVIDTPRGKMVNYGRLGAVNLAAVSVVHREQQKLQEQVNQLRKEFNKRK